MSQRVLLTGANGYLASWVLSELLSRGHSITAVVRSQSKVDKVLSDFPSSHKQLSFHIVPDITLPGAFDAAVQSTPSFTTVIHTASPFHHSVTNNADFLDPAIKGTTSLLHSIKQHAPDVKRVIITSSCAAVIDFGRPVASTPRKIYTEDDWNPITYAEGASNTGSPFIAYRASKTHAERAAWDFLANERPHFNLVTLCPPAIYGPLKHSIASVADLNETTGRIYAGYVNAKKDAPLPPDGVYMYVDVRDIALAHVLAMEVAAAGNERFVVTAGAASSQTIADVLRRDFKELEERTPVGKPGTDSLPENAYSISSEKAKRVLKWEARPLKETFDDMVQQLLEIESGEMSLKA